MIPKANKDTWDGGLWRFHLCKMLAIPHPDYLDTVLSYRQQSDWMRYNESHPLDEQTKDDIRTGLIVQAALAPHSKRKIKLQDCIPTWVAKTKQQVSAKINALAMAWKNWG